MATTYVQTPAFAELRTHLTSAASPITLLEAVAGTGARTTATATLVEECLVAFEIDPGVTLSSLEFDDLPACAGLLIDRRRSQIVDDDFALRRLGDPLNRALSRLVIVVEPGHELAKVADSSIPRVLHDRGPDPLTLFRTVAGSVECGDDETIRTLLAGTTPDEIEAIAWMVVDGVAVTDAASSVTSRRELAVVERLDEVFGRASTDDAALVIATIVLGGLPESTVHRGAASLRSLLIHSKDETESRRGMPRSVRSRLGELGLKRTNDVLIPNSSGSETTIVLDDATQTDQFLLAIWREYDLVTVLSTWFIDLVRTDTDATRWWVATAVALLFSCDSGFRTNGLVDVWAQSDDADDRTTAAVALGTAARDYDAASLVVQKLYELLRQGDDAAWTVAMVLQLGFAEQNLAATLDLVTRLAQRRNPVVWSATSRSLARIFVVAAEAEGDALQRLSDSLRTWLRTSTDRTRTLVVQSLVRFFRDVGQLRVSEADGAALGRLLADLSDRKHTRVGISVAIEHLVRLQRREGEEGVWVLREFARSERSSMRLQKLLRDIAALDNDRAVKAHATFLLETIGWHTDGEDH